MKLNKYEVKYQFRKLNGSWSLPTIQIIDALNSFEVRDRITATYGGKDNVRFLLVRRQPEVKEQKQTPSISKKDTNGEGTFIILVFALIIAALPSVILIAVLGSSYEISIFLEHPYISAIVSTIIIIYLFARIGKKKGIIIYSVLCIILFILLIIFSDQEGLGSYVMNNVNTVFNL